jgi:hypothetical protein
MFKGWECWRCPPGFWRWVLSSFLALGRWVSLKLLAFSSPSRENLEQVHKAASLFIFGHPLLRLCHLTKDQNCDDPDEQYSCAKLFCNRQDRGPVHASHALTVRAFARMPTHAMRLHEWGTRCIGTISCIGHPPPGERYKDFWRVIIRTPRFSRKASYLDN